MADLEDFEKTVRAEAERKISAGRALHVAAASVLEIHETYRERYAEAVAAGFDEAELKRLGLTVDGVKPAPSKTRPKTRAAQGGRGKPRSVASVAPAATPAAAVDTAGDGEPGDAELTA